MEDNRNITTAKKKLFWTPALHRIFLEAIIIIGAAGKDVVAKEILKVMMENVETSNILKAVDMNAQELTRTHVASHWQKLKQFLRSKRIIRRKNKFARWHEQSHFRQQHLLIQRQLVGQPLWFQQDNGSMFYNNNNNVVAAGNLQTVVVAASNSYSPQQVILQAFGDNTVGQDNSGCFLGLSGDDELMRGLDDIRGFQDLEIDQIVSDLEFFSQ